MKRLIALIVTAVCASVISLSAATIRANYKSGDLTHISTEFEKITSGEHAMWIRLEKVVFKDGSHAWIVDLAVEEKTRRDIPKNVKAAFNLTKGGFIRATQIANPEKTRIAHGGLWWNTGRYMMEDKDLESLLGGVESLDLVTGWKAEDVVLVKFPANEFSSALKDAKGAISSLSAKPVKVDGSGISRHSDSRESLTVLSRPIVVSGTAFKYNVGMNYIYYKSRNAEDFELSLQIGREAPFVLPVDSEVKVTLCSGKVLKFSQGKDTESIICIYPSIENLREMISTGVKGIFVAGRDENLEDGFSPAGEYSSALSEVLNTLYQTLIMVSKK